MAKAKKAAKTRKAETPPWDHERPAGKATKLTPASKRKAKASARRAGRSYPSLVDNMNAAKAQNKSGARTKRKPSRRTTKRS
ncbi:MAG: hypothetical protein JWP01_2142 [Myxococcales bacterium]|nr:hypothetical protein [Myxococcales bacterium]